MTANYITRRHIQPRASATECNAFDRKSKPYEMHFTLYCKKCKLSLEVEQVRQLYANTHTHTHILQRYILYANSCQFNDRLKYV